MLLQRKYSMLFSGVLPMSNTWFMYYFSPIPTGFWVLGCHWSGVSHLNLTFHVHNMFKIQTYLLLTKFTYFISDMYFCNKTSIFGSLEVVCVCLFFNIEYRTCHCDNALQAYEKKSYSPNNLFCFCVCPQKACHLSHPWIPWFQW